MVKLSPKLLKEDPVYFGKNILGIDLHQGQKRILMCPDRFIAVKAGRRFGKSYTFGVFAAWTAATNKNCRIVCLATTKNQADELFRTICIIIEDSILNKDVVQKTQSRIVFANGSIIQSAPGKNPNSLRGFTINLLLCDEAAFISDEMFGAIYPTILNVRGKTLGKMILISTPRFKSGEFWKAFQPGSIYTPFEMSYDDAIYDDGTRQVTKEDEELLAQYYGGRDSAGFKRECLGQFGNSEDTFFDDFGVEQSLRELQQIKYGLSGHKYAFGVDLALTQDFTVIVVIDFTDKKNLKVINFERFNGKSTDQIMDILYQKAAAFHPTQVLIDDAKIGASVCSHLKTTYPGYNWQPFNFNTTSKVPLMTDLNIAMCTGIIQIPDDDQIREEMLSFYYEENQNTGHLKLGGEGCHDDFPIAIALALRAANVFTRKDGYTIGSNKGILKPPKDSEYHPNKFAKVLHY